MAWPLAVGMLSFTFMSVVDTLLMGHVGTAAQAGVGLGGTLVFACMAFFRGLTSGAQSVVAAADGAGDGARVRRAGGAALLLGLLSGLAAATVLALVYEPLLTLAVREEAVAESCRRYVGVRLFGLPFALLAFGALSALQGLGDTRARMWVSLAGNVLNVVLDLVLIFGVGPIPALGEEGAALSTVLGSALMAALYLGCYLRRLGRPVRPTLEVLRSTAVLGLPAGTQGLLGVGAMTIMALVLARAGAAQLAASEIVINIVSFSFLPGFGVGEAGGVLVGRYLGARRPESAARALGSARTLALVLMGACALGFALGGEALAGLFSRDPEVVRLAGFLLLMAAGFQLFDALCMVHLCALRAAGDTRFTLVVTTFTGWGLLVPLTLGLGLTLGWGAKGAWLGLIAETAVLAALTAWRVRGIASGRVGRLDLLLGEREEAARAPEPAAAL